MKLKTFIILVFLFTNINALDKIVGLKNIGNTCFMNATLQCLFSLDEFNSLAAKNINNYKKSTSTKYINLLRYYKGIENQFFKPKSFCDAIRNKFKLNLNNRQEDAHELLIKLLEHLTDTDIKKNNQLLKDEFKNLIYTTLKTNMSQGNISRDGPTEQSTNLQVSITENQLSNCLSDFFAQITLESGNQKQYKILSLPKYLIIQLIRFNPDLTKNNENVQLETNLNLQNYLDNEIENQNSNYSLIGVIAQSGENLEVGHYIAYTKRNNQWYKFNDKEIKKLDSAPSGNIKEDYGYTFMPYILFYKKADIESPSKDVEMEIEIEIEIEEEEEEEEEEETQKTQKRKRLKKKHTENTTKDRMERFIELIEHIKKTSDTSQKVSSLIGTIKELNWIPEGLRIFQPAPVERWYWFDDTVDNPWQNINPTQSLHNQINESNVDDFLSVAQEFIQQLRKKRRVN